MTNTVGACQYFAFGGFETFLPLYARSAGMTTTEIGVLFSIHMAAILVFNPVMGKLSDNTGRTPVILAGLLLSAGTLFMISFFDTVIPLAAAFFGLGMAAVTASTSALVSDLCEGSYGSALGGLSMIMDVGHASGPVITGIVINLLGYRDAFSVMGPVLVGIGALFCVIICPNQ